MKIVYVVHEFPPDYIGGTGVATLQVAKDMLARGHKVWVLAPQPWGGDDLPSIGFFDEKVDGLLVRRLLFNPALAPNPILYEYYNPIFSAYAKDFLRDISPDIIHIYHLLHLSSSIIDAAEELRIPIILTLTDFWFICPRFFLLRWDGNLCDGDSSGEGCIHCLREPGNLYDRIDRSFDERMMKIYSQQIISESNSSLALINHNRRTSLLQAAVHRLPFLKSRLRKVGHIICHSSFLSRVFLKRGYFSNGFTLCSPGTILPHRRPLREHAISNITFGYFGTGEKYKGVHVLLEAFRRIESANVTLNLHGNFANTSYVKTIRKIAKSDKRICFMGDFQHKEVVKVLAGIDVLVLPSICYHAFPMSILEAFANGVPAIATDIGGIPELVHHDYNGLLFRRGDVSDLKKKMERVVNEPGLLKKFRKNIPRVRSVNEECDGILDIYKKLLRR